MMRFPLLLIAGLLCSSCQNGRSPDAPAAGSRTVEGGGGASNWIWLSVDTQRVVTEKGEVTFYSFGAPEAAIERGPRWLEHAACPPLSPWKAQAAALAEAQRMRPSVKKWRTAVISLLPLSPYVQEPGPYHGCWYYAVTFHRADMALGGMPESLTIPVLMSGRAVQGTRIQ